MGVCRKVNMVKGMADRIVYNYYNSKGEFVAEKEYRPRNEAEYRRAVSIMEEYPDRYEVVYEVYN